MNDAPTKPRWLDWIPALTFTTLIGSALLTSGGYLNQVHENAKAVAANEARIDKLEAKVELLRSIDTRTARIEAKLEVLVPTEGGKP